MQTDQIVVTGTLLVILVATLFVPLLRYLSVGWAMKRQDIMDSLNASAIRTYYGKFAPGEPPPDKDGEFKAFTGFYDKWYGRKNFLWPSLLLLLATSFAALLVALNILQERDFLICNPLFELPATALSALAGAYLWIGNDFISRARKLDFAPSNVSWACLRLVISVPMGYAFTAVLPSQPDLSAFVGFALGAFPLTTLLTYLRRFANLKLGMAPTEVEAADDIIKLQGVDREIVERLAAEDITSVSQISYCDPVRLTMRSGLTFNFITDCMSQGLAWMYFQDQLGTKLRPVGLRGAVEVACLIDDLDNTSPELESVDAKRIARASIDQLAPQLGISPEQLEFTLRQIAGDPFTIFLCEVWST